MKSWKICLLAVLAILSAPTPAHYTCPAAQASVPGSPKNGWLPEATIEGVPALFETQILSPSESAPEQYFGRGLALSDNTLVVAVDDRNNGAIPERIEIFSLHEGAWQFTASVESPSPHRFEHFYYPALDGDTLMVGAWGYCASGPPDGDCANGAVYVFERNLGGTGNWGLAKQLSGGNKFGARFGSSVVLDGDTAAAGAYGETISSAWGAGAVYLFQRDGGGEGNWGLVRRLESDAAVKVEGDFFGGQLALVGDTLLVGGDDDSVIYEFNRNAGGPDNWGLVQKLPVPSGQAFFAFDGETLVLSIVDPCVPSEGSTVRLAFYSKDPLGSWVENQVIEQDYDPFRVREMALEGNTLVAHTQDYDSAAHLYERGTQPDSWVLKKVLHSSEVLELRYGAIALDKGRALISYQGADVGGRTNEGAVFYYELAKPLNTGHAGAWANLATLGQGQLIDVDAANQFIFLSWFTYTDADPNEQRWLTAQGHYSGSEAILPLYETLGGVFDDPQAVSTEQIGEVTLNFTDCGLGRMRYRIDGEGLSGEFPIERVIPGSDSVCVAESGSALQAVDINAGMDGAWYDENTPGQGFLFDVHPDSEGGNFIFVAWFTYGEDTASGQRWLTAQGPFAGSTAEIAVYETLGGSFDDPQPTETTPVGTMTIDFSDCAHAQLGYALTDGSGSGQIDLARLLPDASELCQSLSGTD